MAAVVTVEGRSDSIHTMVAAVRGAVAAAAARCDVCRCCDELRRKLEWRREGTRLPPGEVQLCIAQQETHTAISPPIAPPGACLMQPEIAHSIQGKLTVRSKDGQEMSR